MLLKFWESGVTAQLQSSGDPLTCNACHARRTRQHFQLWKTAFSAVGLVELLEHACLGLDRAAIWHTIKSVCDATPSPMPLPSLMQGCRSNTTLHSIPQPGSKATVSDDLARLTGSLSYLAMQEQGPASDVLMHISGSKQSVHPTNTERAVLLCYSPSSSMS